MKNIFAITIFLDNARWSDISNYNLINFVDTGITADSKILTMLVNSVFVFDDPDHPGASIITITYNLTKDFTSEIRLSDSCNIGSNLSNDGSPKSIIEFTFGDVFFIILKTLPLVLCLALVKKFAF